LHFAAKISVMQTPKKPQKLSGSRIKPWGALT
jgi:hypothetical protein